MYLLSIANRVRASELLKGFATTTFWSALSKLLIVLTTLYCSNVLTQDEFGEFSFIRNTLSTVLLICATNFSGLAVKFAAEAMLSKESLKKLYILFLFTDCVALCSIKYIFDDSSAFLHTLMRRPSCSRSDLRIFCIFKQTFRIFLCPFSQY